MKKINLFCVIPILFTSCATWNRTFYSSDLAMISAGMTKPQVIQQLNKPEEIVMSRETPKGMLEVFEYVEKPAYYGRLNKAYWTSYWVYFINGKLAGYERADAVNERKRLDRFEQLAQFESLKGTSLMPTQQNININGKIISENKTQLDIYSH
jgi:hypothetical protein